MLLHLFFIAFGMAMLIIGGDFLVSGSSALARRFKISELAIGLTIVAFGTSAPEFVVSFIASINGNPEIALGNVIGSNIVNLLLVLGITGLLAPVAVQKKTIFIEIPFSLFAAILLFVLANFGLIYGNANTLDRIDGIILLLFFCLFILYVFKSMKAQENGDEKTNEIPTPIWKTTLFIVLGLVLLVAGGRFVVNAAVNLALALNISEKIIGLTIVAVGTSLPELVTSVVAIIKKKSDIAIGNIIGSNIFNLLFVLGVSTVARPMTYSPVFNRDIYIFFAGTLLLFAAMFTGKKRILDRWESAVFLLLYIGYVVFLIMTEGA